MKTMTTNGNAMTKIYLSSIIFAANQLVVAIEEKGMNLDEYRGDIRDADEILHNILDEVVA